MLRRTAPQVILRGFGSVFDVFGMTFNRKKYAPTLRSDIEALRNDWRIIGQDFHQAIRTFEQEDKQN